MTISLLAAGTFFSTTNTNNLLGLSAQLNDLQTQLSTGKVSQTYSGLGGGRVTALQFQQQLALVNGFTDSAADTSQRLTFANNALDTLNTSANSLQSNLATGTYSTDASGRIVTQGIASYNFQTAVEVLNTKYGDRYLFSGRASDTQPVAPANTILNGDTTHDGLSQVVAERNQADLGIVAAVAPAIDPPSTGRLILATAGTTSSLTEDVAGSPFGFKFAGIAPTSSTANITATGPAGVPAGISFNVTAQPNSGDTVSFTLTLPDGTTTQLTLAAATSVTGSSSASQFQIGITTAQTAANLGAAITAAINTAAATSLKAASSFTAATNFFSQTTASPAQRVAGPGPATAATSLTTTFASFLPGAKATVAFYNGEEQPTATAANIDTIRNSVASRVDTGLTVGVGVQANETAFTKTLAAFGLVAIEKFNKADPNDKGHYQEIASRAAQSLGSNTTQSVKDVQVQIANVATVVKNTQTRLKQKASSYQTLIDSVEKADTTVISTEILSLQNQLQASYQTTSILAKLNLTNYLK